MVSTTAGKAVEQLEISYPGIKARLVVDDELRPGLTLYVDGAEVATGLRTRINETSKVYFLAAQSGGHQQR